MTDSIAWLDFEPSTLQQAKAADRPLVMVLTVPWCHHCKDLLQHTFGDPQVAATIRDGFVAVQVDAERRPDVNERYGTGGWPTVAFLTPDGELIANENYLLPNELQQRLDRVRTMWRTQRADLEKGLQELWSHKSRPPARKGRLNQQMVDHIADAIYDKFDHRYGGWGDAAKFPHPEALDFALVLWAKRGDDRMREVVTLTLDRMLESPLHDIVDGGFFRFSKTPDWRSPNFEKLLDANAKVLRVYLEGYQLFGNEAYRRTAEGIVGWMLKFLRDPDTNGFYGSQDADADYYNLDAEGRRRREPPVPDRTIHCHANAMAVSGLFKASVVLDRPEWRQQALQVLGFLREELYDGRDVFHYWDGTYHLPGMLADQAYLIRALIDASQLTGDADLLLPAEAIAEQAIARQKAPGGGFFDILNDPRQSGSMRRRNRSILENSVMAEALVRLSYLSRRSEFHREAIETLEAFASDYKEYGYYVAGFGRAVDLVFYEPLVLTIVGDRDSEQAQELRNIALSTYMPSRMVQMLDPRFDPILIGRSGYVVEEQPVVYVTVGRSTREAVRTQEQLRRVLDQIAWERRGQAE
ncbi:MAG: thioredoxin domain-containing protein [Planctomycetota bacterium]